MNNTHSLNELKKINIDVWVEAISNLSDDPKAFAYAINNATDKEIENWLKMHRCPSELVRTFTEYANKNNLRFNIKW